MIGVISSSNEINATVNGSDELIGVLNNQSIVGQINYGNRGPMGPQGPKGDKGDTGSYTAGSNISITDGVISVLTTTQAEQDNTRPITSSGVHTIVGNIEVLLSTI